MIYSSGQDPHVHYGQHFGQTVHAMCSIHTIITKGIMHAAKIAELEVDHLGSLIIFQVTERLFRSKVRRYTESEGHHTGLDYAYRQITQPTPVSKHLT